MNHHGEFDFSIVTIYLVGGAVRDYFLSVEAKDFNYVVVGSSPEEMLNLGFTQVGSTFSVFLHPITKDEYALARTEKKVGKGYQVFNCEWEDVTIEEDLSRRDLTINSIAWDCTHTLGKVVDPFNGRQDIIDKVLRPTSDAFSEDPVRLLRAGRFLSRYDDFTISDELYQAGISLEHSGELDNLLPDRVWKETEKVLHEKHPEKYFEFLNKFNMPFMELFSYMSTTVENNSYHQEDNVFVHTMMVLKYANDLWNDPEINFACLLHDIAKPVCYSESGNAHGHDAEYVKAVKVGEITDLQEVLNTIDTLYDECIDLLSDSDFPEEVDISPMYKLVEDYYFY